MPRWGFKRLRDKNARVAEPVYLHGGIATQRPEQHTEYMLCDTCEQRFRERETYVASLVPGADNRVGVCGLPRTYIDEDTALLDAGSLDCDAIAYFGLSVVWRAAVAKRTLTSVRLGPYEEPFRSYLLDPGSGFPEHAYVLVATYADGMTPGTLLDRMILMPETVAKGTHRTHRFLLCGLDFHVAVGKTTPPFVRRLSLRGDNATRGILLVSFMGSNLARLVFDIGRRAKAVGGLAKRHPDR